MRVDMLKKFKDVEVHIGDGVLTCPVAKCMRGVPVVLPKRPTPFYVSQGRRKKGFLRAYCGFDIETTNLISEDRKRAYMYVWQCAIVTDTEGVVYIGRTWDDFVYLLDSITKQWRTNTTDLLIMWDANLGFEFQFIRKKFDWVTDDFYFFAKEERKPLVATTTGGIQFRECLSISGGGLAQLAKDFTTTQKLVGDLDYKIERNYTTELSPQELDYCINDVVILAEWSKYIFEEFIKPTRKVPLTKTGVLRKEVKVKLKELCKDMKAYKQYIKRAYPNEDTYIFWFEYLFRGGYVHSNYIHTNKVLQGVRMFDITSSYPARMNMSYYPITKFEEVDEGDFDEMIASKCCIIIAEFTQIENRGTHSIESYSKCIYTEGARLDNGRVRYADKMVVALTELDWINYLRFYRWKAVEIRRMWTAERGRLPRFILDVLNKHYRAKSELKAAGLKDTPEYAICKSGVNSAYGLMVTKMQLEQVVYCDDWGVAEVPLNFEDEAEKQILLPQWGIWVAAHARHEVLTMIYRVTKKCGNIVVYCDTDSVKCLDHPDVDGVIRRYNKQIERDLAAAGLADDPAFKDLGMFDDEGAGHVVTRFKTLGAKRYMVELDGKKITATIAGFPKSAIKNLEGDPFDSFDILGMKLTPEKSMKLTTAYIDEWSGDYVAGVWQEEDSSVALYEIPFTMITDEGYYTLLLGAQDSRRSLGRRVDG